METACLLKLSPIHQSRLLVQDDYRLFLLKESRTWLCLMYDKAWTAIFTFLFYYIKDSILFAVPESNDIFLCVSGVTSVKGDLTLVKPARNSVKEYLWCENKTKANKNYVFPHLDRRLSSSITTIYQCRIPVCRVKHYFPSLLFMQVFFNTGP